jgi:hypothetical protein
MNLLVVQKSFVIRMVIAFGLMAGLFVSNSEGIQLFPFPASPTSAPDSVPGFDSGKSKVYCYTVRSSVSHATKVKSKERDERQLTDGDALCGASVFLRAKDYRRPGPRVSSGPSLSSIEPAVSISSGRSPPLTWSPDLARSRLIPAGGPGLAALTLKGVDAPCEESCPSGRKPTDELYGGMWKALSAQRADSPAQGIRRVSLTRLSSRSLGLETSTWLSRAVLKPGGQKCLISFKLHASTGW